MEWDFLGSGPRRHEYNTPWKLLDGKLQEQSLQTQTYTLLRKRREVLCDRPAGDQGSEEGAIQIQLRDITSHAGEKLPSRNVRGVPRRVVRIVEFYEILPPHLAILCPHSHCRIS